LLDCDFYFLVNTSTSLSVSDRLLSCVLSKNVSYFRLGGRILIALYRILFAIATTNCAGVVPQIDRKCYRLSS
jgi:hypothetical protein